MELILGVLPHFFPKWHQLSIEEVHNRFPMLQAIWCHLLSVLHADHQIIEDVEDPSPRTQLGLVRVCNVVSRFVKGTECTTQISAVRDLIASGETIGHPFFRLKDFGYGCRDTFKSVKRIFTRQICLERREII